MTGSVLLVALAVVAATLGARSLARASWTVRAPALGIAAWQALTATITVSLVLAGLLTLVPRAHLSVDLAAVVRACVTELRHQYATPGGMTWGLVGPVLAIWVAVRAGWGVSSEMARTWRARRAHRIALDLVGTYDREIGAVMVEHAAPMVYCLPGRSQRVVMTRGARALLSREEVTCVLAHERAHLRARHDLAIAASEGLRRAFFGWRPFALAAQCIEELAEMHADDGAGRAARLPLADALIRLVGASAPTGALSVGGASALARVVRLSHPRAPLGWGERALILGGLVAMVATPVLLALIPAGAATVVDCCFTVTSGA